LSAFRATLGGLILDANSIHTVGKNSVDSQTQGIYFDHLGQFSSGDANNFIASWYDTEEQKWKVSIRADVFEFGTGENIQTVVTNAATTAANASAKADAIEQRANDGEFDAINVVIDSSAGNIFKNNVISTTLTCIVYRGSTDVTSSVKRFTWKKRDQNGTIDSSWTRPSASTITISNNDVLNRAKFECEVEL
jgi:hypothetical protein